MPPAGHRRRPAASTVSTVSPGGAASCITVARLSAIGPGAPLGGRNGLRSPARDARPSGRSPGGRASPPRSPDRAAATNSTRSTRNAKRRPETRTTRNCAPACAGAVPIGREQDAQGQHRHDVARNAGDALDTRRREGQGRHLPSRAALARRSGRAKRRPRRRARTPSTPALRRRHGTRRSRLVIAIKPACGR